MPSQITTPTPENNTEVSAENTARPIKMKDFIGQESVCKNLNVFIQSAVKRSKALDHTLFYGPPGLGKTTLANIVANEMNVEFKSTAGPILSKTGDLAAILTNLKPKDILFIDEIHRMPITIEEMLYSALEDFKLDIVVGEGPAARSIKIELPPFTLIGATTKMGLLSNPLRSRFGILLPLQFYEIEELSRIITRFYNKMEFPIDPSSALSIARLSRRTPRIALRISRRIIDFCIVNNQQHIDTEIVQKAATQLNIDSIGLDREDISYMQFILQNYNGGPVGIETIAAGLSSDKRSIEETIESFLVKEGLLNKTPKGRMLTEKAIAHLVQK